MAGEKKPETSDVEQGKTFAILAYLLAIIGAAVILLYEESKKNKFAVYHAKQSVALFVLFLVFFAIWNVFPIWIGWTNITYAAGQLIVLVLWLLGLINAANGKQTPLPVIGPIAEKINI